MAKLTVLGIGNVLMSDEGVGVRLLERVVAARDWAQDVEFIDGGVGGLNLLNVIEEAERLVVFDAADMGLSPGEFRVITPEQVADDPAAGSRLSLHELPFIETLKLCERFSRRPAVLRILAIQPKVVARGRELSRELREALGGLVEAGVGLVMESLR